MIGQLKTSLCVDGREYAIKPDFRNILTIIEAYNDEGLKPQEKAYICLTRLYEVVPENIEAAYKAAIDFIDNGEREEDKQPARLIDWTKDESIMFPAINKAAGFETRAVEFIHWHTFLGYFMEVDDGVWRTVLTIRQKKAKHKKLEKWEEEFFKVNKSICTVGHTPTWKNGKEGLAEMLEKLAKEQ